MPFSITLFGTSLLVTALFFALKEREGYTGKKNLLTRVLEHWSPVAEGRWNAFRAWLTNARRNTWARCTKFATATAFRVSVMLRYAVVLLAGKMIKAVRGERFIDARGVPSVFFKNLSENKKKNTPRMHQDAAEK